MALKWSKMLRFVPFFHQMIDFFEIYPHLEYRCKISICDANNDQILNGNFKLQDFFSMDTQEGGGSKLSMCHSTDTQK